MAFDPTFLSAVLDEVGSRCIGARVDKIHQPSRDKGWILLAVMMGLGITLKYIPSVPMAFTASFYSGLGPMLIVAASRYLAAMV